MEKYNKYNQILISELIGCKFTIPAMNLLNDNKIYTLQDLFVKSENINFAEEINSSMVNQNIFILNEIIGTTKLLRCKYLDEDPKIPFYEPIKIDIETDFGFSAKVINTLKRGQYDNIKLFDIVSNKTYHRLLSLRNSGPCLIKEIESKTSIAYDYYIKKCSEHLDNSDIKIDSLEELRDLFLKLEKLTEMQNKVYEEIKIVQQQIKKKLNGKVMIKK